MQKKNKKELRQDSVTSKGFHVGIELELKAPCDGGGHNDDACYEARYESERDYLRDDLGAAGILREFFDVSRETSNRLAEYFDTEAWVSNYMDNWESDGCSGDCAFGGNSHEVRENIANELETLTGNSSIKVVEDGSINCDDDQTDAEVCWNYFASRETLADNVKILKHLEGMDCSFDNSCGLHINLNNYLNVPTNTIDKDQLEFLFNFVHESRRNSNYCNRIGMSSSKYSMIFNQSDRLEFRLFSPTLDAVLLNHYVTLANTVYRRLAGKNAKLPKRTAAYFLEHMIKVNNLSAEVASASILAVNTLKSSMQLDAERTMRLLGRAAA